MPRLCREVIITEKIDGTNAQIAIEHVSKSIVTPEMTDKDEVLATRDVGGAVEMIRAGSRSRWLTRKTDNFGFAKWVQENSAELFKLGEGRHFGEWWGSGVQRGYGLPKGEKRLSLFNVDRWLDTHEAIDSGDEQLLVDGKKELAPVCCHVVPTIWRGIFDTHRINAALEILREHGSFAAPGFPKPEGVIVWHVQGRFGLKKTLENDEQPKSQIK